VEEITTHRNVVGDIVRYAAPELLENPRARVTTSSDVCSFAMLVLQCITGEIPFSILSHDVAVFDARVSERLNPPRPDGWSTEHVSDGLWDLMTRCWSYQPDHRPPMEEVHSFFQLHHPTFVSGFENHRADGSVMSRGSGPGEYTVDDTGTNSQVSGIFLRRIGISITGQTRLGYFSLPPSRSKIRRDNLTDLKRIRIEGISFPSPRLRGGCRMKLESCPGCQSRLSGDRREADSLNCFILL